MDHINTSHTQAINDTHDVDSERLEEEWGIDKSR